MTLPERVFIESEPDLVLRKQHLARYEFASTLVRNKRVLDVACGSGYGTAILAESGAASTIGMDISDECVKYAKEHHGAGGIIFITGNGEDLSSLEPVDVVVSFETIEHLHNPEKFLNELRRILRDNGVLVISTPIRQVGRLGDKPTNPFHLREWNSSEFNMLLSRYFGDVKLSFQFGFRKMWFPYSRTFWRSTARLLHPKTFEDFVEYRVCSSSPGMLGVAIWREYVVAVCTSRPGR